MNPAEKALELRPGYLAALSEVFLYWIFALIARRVMKFRLGSDHGERLTITDVC